MSNPALLLIGAGGHANACIDVIEQQDQFAILGLIGMPHEVGQSILGYPIIGSDDDWPRLAKECQYTLIGVGQIQSPASRMRLYQQAIELGFRLPPIISPTAYVSRHATLGTGTIVMHGATINAGAKVGNNCIINSSALIEHDANVEDHCHISTGAILNGGVRVGEGSFVGSGSLIKEGVSLGKSCLVGMGVCVRHDQPVNARVTDTA